MEALGRAIFIALKCLGNCFSMARFYTGDDLEKFSGDPEIFGDGASRSPSRNLCTNLGTVLVTGCSKWPVYATGDYRGFLRSPLFSVGR
jgi:hypothetical protein